MDAKIEKEIIKLYFKKEKQDRILWELNSAKKRADVMWRLCGEDLIKHNCIHPIPFMSADELGRIICSLGGTTPVYSFNFDFIGYMSDDISLNDILQNIICGEYGACLTYFGKGVAYFLGMQEKGAPDRFILLPEGRKMI